MFDCQIYIKGKKMLTMGQKVMSVFFCYRNGARIVDPLLGINLTDIGEGSFFGDYQILLGIKTSYDYEAELDRELATKNFRKGKPETTWCLTIPADYFLALCQEFPEFRSFLTSRGKKRRSFLIYQRRQLIKILGL